MKEAFDRADRLLEDGRLRAAVSLAVPVILMAASLALFGIRYETNDDASFANIAAGAYGADNLHMFHPGILFSLLLKPFYLIRGSVNWYVIVQLALAVISLAVIMYVLSGKRGSRGALLALALMIPFSVHIFYWFQYTRISTLAVTAGLLLVAAALERGPVRALPGILLALAGSAIRFESFIMGGGLCAMLLLFTFMPLDAKGKVNSVKTMALLFLLVFGARAADLMSYSLDSEWKDFRRYHDARIEFSDYKVYALDVRDPPFDGLGISGTDLELLLSWNYYDPRYFTPELLDSLSGAIPAKSVSRSLSDAFSTAVSLVRGDSFRYAFALSALFCLVILGLSLEGAALVLTWGVFAALLIYLHYRGRFPLWVQASILMSASFAAAMLLARSRKAKNVHPAAFLLLLAALCAATVPTLVRTRENSIVYHDWTVSKQERFDRMSADKENLYLISVEDLDALAGYDVFHPRRKGYFSNIVVLGGMVSNSPYTERVLDSFGIERPLVDSLDRSDVYIDSAGYEVFRRYIAEQTGKDVSMVKESDNLIAPYRAVTG